MNIHIVCRDPDEDKILARLARALSAENGWTLSDAPREDVDLNYFIIYIDLAERWPGWHETPVAAYFSHYEAHHHAKAQWWHAAATMADLAIITADQYGDILPIPSIKARPPANREMFTPGEGRKPGRVGVSGIVTGRAGERKGRDLVQKLRHQRPTWDIIATGQGWPVPTQWRHFSDLPNFYRSLAVFLCTSTVEGIPMPPLEALSCGVPIVIPQGVGMLDELEGPGLYRYPSGDYADMLIALTQALAAEHDAEALRAITESYTAENWAADHLHAFEGFLWPAHEDDNLPDWQGHSGMYCVAFGKPSRKCAVTCIQSFKRHNPGVPVALAAASPLDAGEDVFIEFPDLDIGGRQAKLAVYDKAPADWRYVLYLDADTETVGDLSPLFRFLADGWEALICKDMAKYHVAKMMIRPDNKAEYEATLDLIGTGEVMQYNGGVFGFRRCARTQRFFELWNKEWQRWGARDQGALLRALYQHPLRVLVLSNQWNASDRYPMPAGEVAVIHHNLKARRWQGLIDGRIDSREAWQAVKHWEARQK